MSQYCALIHESVKSGARKSKACEVIGLSIRTLQRWLEAGEVGKDKRPTAKRPAPANKLTEQERQTILELCNQDLYASLPPSQIVPQLADNGQYVASESSFYRVLKANNQLEHRGKDQPKRKPAKPSSYTADYTRKHPIRCGVGTLVIARQQWWDGSFISI